MNRRAKKLELTGEKVLQELALLAFANMTDYIEIGQDGAARVELSRVDREKGAAIQEVTVDEITRATRPKDGKPTFETVKRIKFRLADKGQNLERLGRHLKLFTDKVELMGMESLAERIGKARKRAGL